MQGWSCCLARCSWEICVEIYGRYVILSPRNNIMISRIDIIKTQYSIHESTCLWNCSSSNTYLNLYSQQTHVTIHQREESSSHICPANFIPWPVIRLTEHEIS
jgi:hypothetical protein